MLEVFTIPIARWMLPSSSWGLWLTGSVGLWVPSLLLDISSRQSGVFTQTYCKLQDVSSNRRKAILFSNISEVFTILTFMSSRPFDRVQKVLNIKLFQMKLWLFLGIAMGIWSFRVGFLLLLQGRTIGGRTNPSRCQEFVKPRSMRLKCKHFSKRKRRLSSRANKQNKTIATISVMVATISVMVFYG